MEKRTYLISERVLSRLKMRVRRYLARLAWDAWHDFLLATGKTYIGSEATKQIAIFENIRSQYSYVFGK